jgi:Mg2+/Co2+ transporter CorB
LPSQHRSILSNLFDLEDVTVDDAMRPRSQIEAINLAAAPEDIVRQLGTSHHARLPVYQDDPNNIIGMLHVRRALARLQEEVFDAETFRTWLREPYYIPSGTSLYVQLTQFQATRQSLGLVVDEYGELLGLVTVEDILEEIVGEFTAVLPGGQNGSNRQADGSYLVDGAASLRELNRKLKMQFPLDGPRTLNGLLLEYLEAMPEAGVSVMIAGYPVEVVQVQERMVKTARIGPRRAQS